MSSEEISVRDIAPGLGIFSLTSVTWLGGAIVVESSLQAPMFVFGTLAGIVVYGAVHDPSILDWRAGDQMQGSENNEVSGQ